MKRFVGVSLSLLLVLSLGVIGLAGSHGDHGQDVVYAVAEITPFEEGGPTGIAFFVEADGVVYVTVRAHGLANPLQGVHIHEIGDLSSPGASGGHFDPTGGSHAHPDEHGAHAGDLINIEVDENGVGTLVMVKDDITLSPGPLSVAGRAIVIHAEEDLFTPENIGGGRVAGGIIEVVSMQH